MKDFLYTNIRKIAVIFVVILVVILIAIGTESGTVQLWDTATGEKQKTIARQEYYAGVDDLSILPDNRTLAVVCQSMLDLFNINTVKPRNKPPNASDNNC